MKVTWLENGNSGGFQGRYEHGRTWSIGAARLARCPDGDTIRGQREACHRPELRDGTELSPTGLAWSPGHAAPELCGAC